MVEFRIYFGRTANVGYKIGLANVVYEIKRCTRMMPRLWPAELEEGVCH